MSFPRPRAPHNTTMPLKRYNNKIPNRFFDKALNSAYERHYRFGLSNQKNEPGFVRELISTATINHLNLASARVYDDSANMVYFRGGYLHARPYASFQAQAPNGPKQCRRELADALIVVYVTAPLVPGAPPQVIRRTACLVMFKRDTAIPPRTPLYEPKVDPLPPADPNKKFTGDGDKEQFYFFAEWPKFSLEVGQLKNPVPLGTFQIATVHDIGKFGLVWGEKPGSKWNIDRKPKAWLFANPIPSKTIGLNGNEPTSGSLGFLLEEMIDANAGAGRDFSIKTPQTQKGDWDDLMSRLLGYPTASPNGTGMWDPGFLQQQGNYYGAGRNINPAMMQFMPAVGPALDDISLESAAFFDKSCAALTPRDAMRWHELIGPKIEHYLPALDDGTKIPFTSEPPDDGEAEYLPVLIATVHKHAQFGD